VKIGFGIILDVLLMQIRINIGAIILGFIWPKVIGGVIHLFPEGILVTFWLNFFWDRFSGCGFLTGLKTQGSLEKLGFFPGGQLGVLINGDPMAG